MWLQNYETTGYPLRPSRPTPYSVQPPNQLVFQLCTTQYCRDSEKHEALHLKFSDIFKKNTHARFGFAVVEMGPQRICSFGIG